MLEDACVGIRKVIFNASEGKDSRNEVEVETNVAPYQSKLRLLYKATRQDEIAAS